MKPWSVPTARDQRGFALIAILALAALITAFLIASGLNRSRADVSSDREQRSMDALRQAKAALIAYVASEQWQNTGGATPFQPGAFPCPDRDNDGIAEDHEVPQRPCNTALKRIGRLPWKTIGSDDLRDASGERLWYVVSSTFLKNTPAYTNVINSESQGLLTVTGTAAATNVIAIVFAPGEAIIGQSRDSTNAVTYNDPINFLELFNNATYATFTSNALPSDSFNDRLLVITQADVMSAVEPVVAAKIERDIVPNIQDYVNGWNAFPFPVPFDPTQSQQSAFQGDKNQNRGLLPVTTDPTFVKWDTSSIIVTEIAGGTGAGTGSPPPAAPPNILDSPPDCGASTDTQIICKINYAYTANGNRPNIQLRATLRRAGLGFPKPFAISDAVMTGSDGNLVEYNGSDYAYWSPVPPDWPFPNVTPTVNHTVSASGDGTVVFTGRLQNNGAPPDGTGGRVTITITLSYEPLTNSLDTTTGWFLANGWHRQTYYAVGQGALPKGGGSPGCPCLTVNNLRPSYSPPYNNKQAIMVLAGRQLNGPSSRPSTNLADYFENANFTAAGGTSTTYENRSGLPTTINDRVVVILP